MGLPRFFADRPIVTAAFHRSPAGTGAAGRLTAPGIALSIPNPHVVVELSDVDALEALDLRDAPDVEPALPEGQNVEFVVRRGPQHLAMRVHERGSGETRSCGTGICAAVVALAAGDGTAEDGAAEDGAAGGGTWRVDVPGGTCYVMLPEHASTDVDAQVVLIGPAVLVGTVDVDDDWLAARHAG